MTAPTRDGEGFPAHLAMACVFESDGRMLGTVGALRDLTELVAAQQWLIERETLASLGEMAAVVAHDIRNPLGGIKTAAQFLSSRPAGDGRTIEEMVVSVLAGVSPIESIVTDLLDYARGMQLDRHECRLGGHRVPVLALGSVERFHLSQPTARFAGTPDEIAAQSRQQQELLWKLQALGPAHRPAR